MEEGVPKPKVTTVTYRPTKYFISSLNTHLGHVLVNRLRNQSVHPQNPNSIIGTLVTQKQKLEDKYNFTPEGVRKVIETDKVQFFHDVLLNSDVIIYDLNTCNLDEAESAISALKISEYTQNKTLICISNVMTWAKSKPKQKKQGEEQEDENPVQQPDSEQEGTQPPAEEGQKKPIVRFTQKDFNMRRPHPAYEKIKSMQTLCIAAGTARANLKTYVICSGIVYGAGQNLLRQYFMQARLQKPQALSVYGKGKNRIPTVHLYDLVTYIEKTIQKKPQIPYILALDQNPKPTQKKIIQAISKGIGTGRVVHVPAESTVKNIDMLTLNLRMKPCMFFAKLQAEDEAKQPEEGVQLVKFKFNWSAKEGIQKNIEKLRQQFNQNLGLKQEKIFIMGPPGCGKSYFAKGLSKKYNLPHLHINQVIEWVKSLQTELGEQIRNAFNEKKQAEIAAKQQEYEANKQKWKKIPKELRQPLQPFNPDKVVVKLPDELVYKCYLERLRQNDCLNRGYILDGYPKKYQDAVQLFMELPTPAEGEEPDENAKKILNKSLAPTKFILLEQSDEKILERLQQLPEQTITGTHFTQKEAKRRLKIYRDLMNSSTGDFVLSDFFTEQNQISQHKIEIHNINVTDQTEALLQSIVKPISVSQGEEHALVNQIIEREKQRKQKIREEMTRKQEIVRNIQAEDYRMKKQNEQNEERQILDKKSLALRKYLDVNLVPILSEGIFQILKQFPKDPVDRLAEFLFKNSLKVPNPDPSTFEF